MEKERDYGIKIEYFCKPYNYQNISAGQFYDIKTVMELDSDISATEAILAFVRLLKIATYRVSPELLEDVAQIMRDEEF